MCLLHSPEIQRIGDQMRGRMSHDSFIGILDAFDPNPPVITPNRWSEPLMLRDLRKYYRAMKQKGSEINLNTNGLLLTQDLAEFFVDIRLDSISFSIDATCKETLQKLRGTDALERLHATVHMMLEVRGTGSLPRIGTSMTLGKENEHEKDAFVANWLHHVDVVRINRMYDENFRLHRQQRVPERIPCEFLYTTMVVDFKGDVFLCCLDVYGKEKIGNVFEEGVSAIWNGERFTQIRSYHENGQYDKIPLCKNCETWSNAISTETQNGEILIRETPIMTFYNRLDRLNNWKDNRSTKALYKPEYEQIQ